MMQHEQKGKGERSFLHEMKRGKGKYLVLIRHPSPSDLQRLLRLELDDGDVDLLVEERANLRTVVVGEAAGEHLLDVVVCRALDDGLCGVVLGRDLAESQFERVVASESVGDSLCHLYEQGHRGKRVRYRALG